MNYKTDLTLQLAIRTKEDLFTLYLEIKSWSQNIILHQKKILLATLSPPSQLRIFFQLKSLFCTFDFLTPRKLLQTWENSVSQMLYLLPTPSLLQGTGCYPVLQALDHLAVFTPDAPMAWNIHIQILLSFYRC